MNLCSTSLALPAACWPGSIIVLLKEINCWGAFPKMLPPLLLSSQVSLLTSTNLPEHFVSVILCNCWRCFISQYWSWTDANLNVPYFWLWINTACIIRLIWVWFISYISPTGFQWTSPDIQSRTLLHRWFCINLWRFTRERQVGFAAKSSTQRTTNLQKHLQV